MKTILITQRSYFDKKRQEQQDILDQQWISFLLKCKLCPIILPNHLVYTKKILKKIHVDGILLTGGNNLKKYHGDAPERDRVEQYLLKHAIQRKIPLLGVCRGMQLVQDYFGIKLIKISGHIKKQQKILINNHKEQVNSYHTYGTKDTTETLKILARTQDGIIKAIKHKKYPIAGIMWHPERINPFRKKDIHWFTNFFHPNKKDN